MIDLDTQIELRLNIDVSFAEAREFDDHSLDKAIQLLRSLVHNPGRNRSEDKRRKAALAELVDEKRYRDMKRLARSLPKGKR